MEGSRGPVRKCPSRPVREEGGVEKMVRAVVVQENGWMDLGKFVGRVHRMGWMQRVRGGEREREE